MRCVTSFQSSPEQLHAVRMELRLLAVERQEDTSVGSLVRQLLDDFVASRRAARGVQAGAATAHN